MSTQRDEERALADRLVTYADALVAIAFVGVSGLGLAVADPDIRSDMMRAAGPIAVFNLFFASLISGVITLLRRWELELRVDLPPAARSRRLGRYLHWARLGIIWTSASQSVLLMWLIA